MENKLTDRQKVMKLFDLVGEHDETMRDYVLDQCKDDVEIRRGYVAHYALAENQK